MTKREIWWGLTGDGCGAANLDWFETKEKAKEYIRCNNDGLADVCTGKLTITANSFISIMEIDE